MNPELWAVGGIIAAAVAYLGWAALRTFSGTRKGCGSGCGQCPSSADPPPAASRRPLPMAG